MTNAEIVREYNITEEDIKAALAHTGELVERKEYHPLPKQ
jgi:uncharacterized protein (DUF433 family)